MDSSLSFGEGWDEAFELLYILMRLPYVCYSKQLIIPILLPKFILRAHKSLLLDMFMAFQQIRINKWKYIVTSVAQHQCMHDKSIVVHPKNENRVDGRNLDQMLFFCFKQ